MTTRDDVVLFSKSLAGLSAAEPTRAAYLALIAPGETPARAAEMALMSGCALVARAVLRRFIAHPLLERPYRTGDAMADIVAIAREAGALHGPERDPRPGDMVIVGGGSDGGGPEHVWTCVDDAVDAPDYGLFATGVDGGQRDAGGFECVLDRAHDIGDGIDRCAGSRRKIRNVIDVEHVIARLGRDAQ